MRHSEALYEDESFPERELAALVAAKVYYQLQEYNESMVFALGAGKLLDIHKAGEFEETILGTQDASTAGCNSARQAAFSTLRSGYSTYKTSAANLFVQRNVLTPTSPCPQCTTHRPQSARPTRHLCS